MEAPNFMVTEISEKYETRDIQKLARENAQKSRDEGKIRNAVKIEMMEKLKWGKNRINGKTEMGEK